MDMFKLVVGVKLRLQVVRVLRPVKLSLQLLIPIQFPGVRVSCDSALLPP